MSNRIEIAAKQLVQSWQQYDVADLLVATAATNADTEFRMKAMAGQADAKSYIYRCALELLYAVKERDEP